MSWFADDIDFTRVGVGRNEIQAHAAAWPQMHLASLQMRTQGYGPVGYSLFYGIGLIQFHVARIQYFLNRID